MKTRKSLLGQDVLEKELLSRVDSGGVDSPTIVRKLRSRTITSDTEDESYVRTTTPKSTRKSLKVNSKSSPLCSNKVSAASLISKDDVRSEARTPRQNKRLSSANLFKIVEVKEEVDVEECEGKLKEAVESVSEEVTAANDEDSSSVASRDTAPCKEWSALAHVREETEILTHENTEGTGEETEEDTNDGEGCADAIKEEDESNKDLVRVEAEEGEMEDFDCDDDVHEAASLNSSRTTINPELSFDTEGITKKKKRGKNKEIRMHTMEKEEEEDTSEEVVTKDEHMQRDIGDLDSDDDIPEAVSFSSSKNTINAELSLIAEAVRKEKEKRKELARKKIEMIRMQKAEKEKKRLQKMKFQDISIPERLAEEITSNLPDVPDIPTVKNSDQNNKKRKNEKKVEKLENKMEERKNKILKFDDYIPITGVLGSTKFGVVPLEVAAKIPKPSSQSAAQFKQKALFGSRIQREPSKNLLIYRQKLSAAGRLHKGFKSSGIMKV